MTTPQWIIEDLARSGLTPETFPVTPLKSKDELMRRLGFSKMGEGSIFEIGGYWIEYPNTEGFYRLKLKEPISDVKYLSPKGAGNHPYIPTPVHQEAKDYKPDTHIFITEGEKKAAKATLSGFPCIGLSGVFNFTDSESGFLSELKELNFKHRAVYIVFDSDIVGKVLVRQAELRLAVELMNREAKVWAVRLPGEKDDEKNGLDDYLVRHGKEKFDKLLSKAKPTFELHISEGTPTDIILKEAAKINSRIEIEKILKHLAKNENIPLDAVRKEFAEYIPKEKGEADSKSIEVYSDDDLKKAQKLLQSPNILQKLLEMITKAGYVGEDINIRILFLIFISRLLFDSLSCIIKGSSASGKSFLVRTVLKLIPKEYILSFSFLTAKALVHSENDLSHKILFIQEHKGSESADYSVRTSLSERELSIMIPVKDELTGNFTSIEKRIKAEGLVFVETTTKDRVHQENQTRVFDLYLDESEEQTENVLNAEAEGLKNEDSLEEDLRYWRGAHSQLKPHEVLIPYAKQLVPAFPKGKVRIRRDFKRFLSLIKAHALLFQYQRTFTEDGKLIATTEDLEAILPLAEVVLVQSFKELTPKQEDVLDIIQSEFNQGEFSLKALDRKTNLIISYRTLQRYVEFFVKEGFLEWNGLKAKESRYALSSSVTSCRNTPFSTLNLSKSLEIVIKDLRQNDLTSNDVSDVKDAIDDINGNSRQKGLTSKESNNDSQLGHKKPIDVITSDDIKEDVLDPWD